MARQKTKSKRRTKTASKPGSQQYLHGFNQKERERLLAQARICEPKVHDRLPFRRTRKLLEVGSGVGAQTEILLRHFPDVHVTSIELNPTQIAAARQFLETIPWARGRYELKRENAMHLSFQRDSFDGAFVCWTLEHVEDPARVLAEVRRVLVPGSPIVASEVLNSTFFIDPYSPNMWKYWMAFNDHQIAIGGDPFVGAKLGNLLQANGYHQVATEVKTFHLDNREPAERAEFIGSWTELLLSGAPQLIKNKLVSKRVVEEMKQELDRVGHDPNSVFFYSFVQARAKA